MKKILFISLACICFASMVSAQIGKRFPSERKVIKDPVTGVELIFLTSQQGMGDSKLYPTENQWTSDGQWLIFRSNRANGEAIAVNEETGEMVQVTEGGSAGYISRTKMALYFTRTIDDNGNPVVRGGRSAGGTDTPPPPRRSQVVEVDLASLFADVKKGSVKAASFYQKALVTIPASAGAGGGVQLDANGEVAYFTVSREVAAQHLAPGTKIAETFGPRNMGAGPSGLSSVNLKTGEVKYVVTVPFQMGHMQTNPWVPGEIMFCWETGGKAPKRMWTVKSDGTGLRPVYDELETDWVTHESYINGDEVAFAVMGHRPIGTKGFQGGTTNPGQEDGWGPSGTRAHFGGLGIANLRTGEVYLAGQTKSGSGLWHVHGSYDGRFAVGDDFKRDVWLIDRKTNEMKLLSAGHKDTAQDHVHPTFSPCGTKIQIQSAMLSEDNRSMNICVIKLPQDWLNRK